MYKDEYHLRLDINATIVTSYFGASKVFRVRDILYSNVNNSDSFIAVQRTGKKELVPIKECELVPTDLQLKRMKEDRDKYINTIQQIDHLMENYKLRPAKK